MTARDDYQRRRPPHSPTQAFVDEQEERHEDGHRNIVNGAANGAERGYDRSGKPMLSVYDPAEMLGKAVPVRDWLIEGWLLRRTVALVTGDGGMGKSLLMQILGTACAIQQDWLGIPVKPLRTFCVFCEDDQEELEIRQHQINKHYGVGPQEISDGGFRWTTRPGMDNILETFDRNTDRGTKSPLWHELRQAAIQHRAELVIFDTAADVYGGNENFRTQVRNFISSLRGLAIELNGSVILTAHPSVSGLSTGSGISGSTAWHNSVRARAYLTKPMSADGEDHLITQRILKFPKNNSGPASGSILLEWSDGVFKAIGAAGAHGARTLDTVDMIELQVNMLTHLRAMVEQGSMVQSATDYHQGFVGRLRKLREFQSYTLNQLISAQEAMVAKGRVVRVEIGPASKRRKYLRLPDQQYPGEQSALPV